MPLAAPHRLLPLRITTLHKPGVLKIKSLKIALVSRVGSLGSVFVFLFIEGVRLQFFHDY